MAKLFSQNKTTNMTTFKNWLEENKTGTFLENATFAISKTNVNNDTLTITLNDSAVKFIGTTSQNAVTFEFVGQYMTFTRSTSTSYGTSSTYAQLISGAMLSTHGLILKYNGGYNSQSTATISKYPIILTVDSAGNLAVVAYTGAVIANAAYSTYDVMTYKSTATPTSNVYPNFSAPSTSLAPIAPYCDDPTTTLPYCYAAAHTQVGGEGFSQITLNDENYITNGYWYVND